MLGKCSEKAHVIIVLLGIISLLVGLLVGFIAFSPVVNVNETTVKSLNVSNLTSNTSGVSPLLSQNANVSNLSSNTSEVSPLLPVNLSNNANSNTVENKTESVTTSENSSLLPQIVTTSPSILTILVPLIIIWWFRKDIQKLFSKNNVTSVEIPGLKVGLVSYPEVVSIGQKPGLVWSNRFTEMLTPSLFDITNISEEEVKRYNAEIEKNLEQFQLREPIGKAIDNSQQKKPCEEQLEEWRKYAEIQLEEWRKYAERHCDIGQAQQRLADIYSVINKKDEATYEISKAKDNLESGKEILSKVSPFIRRLLNHNNSINYNELGNIENFEDLILFLKIIMSLGLCKHLEAYVYKAQRPPATLRDAIKQYKKVLNYIKRLFGEYKNKQLIESIDQKKIRPFMKMESDKLNVDKKGEEDDKKKLEDSKMTLIRYVVLCNINMAEAYLFLSDYEKVEENLNELDEILKYFDKNQKKYTKIKTNKLKWEYESHSIRGRMYFQKIYLDKAEQEFDETIKISNIKELGEKYGYNLSPYWWKIKNKYDYAKRLYANGLINEAEKTFKEATEIFEHNKGKIEEAFRKGSTLPFTGMAQVYYDLGLLYINRNDTNDLESAETKFREAINILPEDPELHIALGNVKFSNGDYKEAIKEYDHALRQDPSHPIALLNRTVAAQNMSGRSGEKDGKDKKQPKKSED